jgi:hypothetical protein
MMFHTSLSSVSAVPPVAWVVLLRLTVDAAAANLMATTQHIGGLRYGKRDERHRVGVVGGVGNIRCKRELHPPRRRRTGVEAPRSVLLADERPQSPRYSRRVPQPPTAIVLMFANRRNGMANRADAAFREQIAGEPDTRLQYFFSPYHQTSALYPVISQLSHAQPTPA